MLSFFFFKQNTAYEMRISDWSSDVCSSDLLKSIGEYDNTMIVFFSDNGADGMGYGFIPFIDSNLNLDIDNSLANYGRQGSFIFRSTRWAEVGTAPFRLFKRSEEHTSELQSLMRISYAVFCLKKKKTNIE